MIRVALLCALCAAPVAAQEVQPQDIPQGQKDYHAAEAGTYKLDPYHSAVIARVPHMGFSYSVFRFDAVSGELGWNPDDPAAMRLTAEVQVGSISTPVEGFAEVLKGAEYLNTAANPVARFVSERFAPESDTKGAVSGQLTLMGRTHPATFAVELVGAGKGFTGDENGNPVIRNLIGVHAETQIDPQAYGMNAFFTAPIPLVIDAEFARSD
ncbi:YceI family protein [Paracoccus sp. N5]|uniref:YceI family protein n=1 Tax=Paracoccus sp. N5 TaxID=1101189 RepID=UPI00037D8310|nr:YceI family protein [Paracoccus sp. N5]